MRKPPKADNRKSTHNTTPLNNTNLVIFFFFSSWALSFLSVFHFFFLKKKLLGIQKQRGPVAQTCLYSGHKRSLKPFHSDTQRPKAGASSLFLFLEFEFVLLYPRRWRFWVRVVLCYSQLDIRNIHKRIYQQYLDTKYLFLSNYTASFEWLFYPFIKHDHISSRLHLSQRK